MDNLTNELKVLRTENDELHWKLIALINNIMSNENLCTKTYQKMIHDTTDKLCENIEIIQQKKHFNNVKNNSFRNYSINMKD
jgi:hypothetical protein